MYNRTIQNRRKKTATPNPSSPVPMGSTITGFCAGVNTALLVCFEKSALLLCWKPLQLAPLQPLGVSRRYPAATPPLGAAGMMDWVDSRGR